MGISAPLLPKVGKYDVRVVLVCICIWQVDLRLIQSTYQLAWNTLVMSLVSWYDSIPFHFRIFSISAPTLTYHDAWN